MKLYTLCIVSAVALPALVNARTALADPKGLWLAEDGAKVRVSSCGKALCATIASPKSPTDPTTGMAWTDKNNADPGKRGRPLVGVFVLSAMLPDAPEGGRESSTTPTMAILTRDIWSKLIVGQSGSKAASSAFAAVKI